MSIRFIKPTSLNSILNSIQIHWYLCEVFGAKGLLLSQRFSYSPENASQLFCFVLVWFLVFVCLFVFCFVLFVLFCFVFWGGDVCLFFVVGGGGGFFFLYSQQNSSYFHF